MNDSANQSDPRRVECPSAGEPYVRLFILAAILVAIGIWCFLDRHKYVPPPAWTAEYLGEAFAYVLNHYGLFFFVPLGVLFAVLGLRIRKRLLIADEEGIGYAGKAKTPWSQIAGLDASKLEEKQVLRLNLASGARMKLDGWKLKNFKDLVAFIEQKVPGTEPSTNAPPDEKPQP